MIRRELDPRTLRYVARKLRSESTRLASVVTADIRKNGTAATLQREAARGWGGCANSFATEFLDQAKTIERKQKPRARK